MRNILLLGNGRIGAAIAAMLGSCGDYQLRIADRNPDAFESTGRNGIPQNTEFLPLDVNDQQSLLAAMQDCDAVICALSFRFSEQVAHAALQQGCSYFDLTEDIAACSAIRELAEAAIPGQIFMPQCGLAPGYTAIIANDLAQRFEQIETVRVRVGALPLYPSNSLKYNLTWSTEGLINEYCQPCETLHDGELILVPPLSELETFSIDGVRYEAFHTSGGLGTLCSALRGRARNVNYKTVRYPGHRDLARFLLEELKFIDRRELLCELLEQSIPVTDQDLVLAFCTVTGRIDGHLHQITDARKIYHANLHGAPRSAIQIATAAALCAAVDLHFSNTLPDHGFVHQQDIRLSDFLENRFGKHFALGNTVGTVVSPLDRLLVSHS